MFSSLLEAVAEEASGDRALESVRALSRFHRVQASPGYDRAAEWLASQLEAMGLEVETESAPGDGRSRRLGCLMPEGWECRHATATLIDGRRRQRLCDYEAEKLSLVLRSAAARGRYRVVRVEGGAEESHYEGVDVRGAVVLADDAPQRVHELAVVARGAAGLLTDHRRLVPPVRDAFDDPDALAYTSFWWGGDAPRGWGFVVTPRAGRDLRERLRRGAKLELEVTIDARAFPTTLPLVSARLPGAQPGEALIVSHLCHPQPSANDNASGVAANLEAARTLAALRARGAFGDRGRSVRFLFVPEFTGTHAWLDRPGRAAAVAGAVNLDMVGQDQAQCGSTFLLEHPPCFAASFAEELLRRIRFGALDWVRSYSGPGHYSMTRTAEVPYSGGSDHAVFIDPAIGVPCPMLIQWPDRYYHSSHDTPDKTDPASLGLAARCAATYAGFLAGAGEREYPWLLGAVGRGARRRLLEAADATRAPWAIAHERRRGDAALGSLARLGVGAGEIDAARAALDEFARRETSAAESPPATSGREARPRRRLGAPIMMQRYLIEGWDALPREQREGWRRREAAIGDGLALAEVAWYACDGTRTLDDIATLVWLESGRHEPAFVEELFQLTARLGLSEWATAAATSRDPDVPSTAGR